MTEGNWLALIAGTLCFAISVCLSVSLGLLVEPWLGFMAFAGFCTVALVVVLVSYRNAHPSEER